MNITKGKIQSAQKVVIYGPEGIGKSTFASKFPNPVFIDTEGSTKNIDVARYDRPTSFEMLKQQIDDVISKRQFSTLVIDTADWAEKLCAKSLCASCKKKSIEDFGYGKGYTMLMEDFGKMLNKLEEVVEAGINVVVTAHAFMRKFEQPDEAGAYDRWELKLEKKVAPLVKEWADMLLFCNYKTLVIKVADDKYKATGGQERVMYTTHNACYDAKNRHGLPEVLPFDYSQISHIIESKKPSTTTITSTVQPTPQQTKTAEIDKYVDDTPPQVTQTAPQELELPSYIPKALADLMRANKITEEDLTKAVSQKGYYPEGTSIANYDPEFIDGCLIKAWDKVHSLILSNQDIPF